MRRWAAAGLIMLAACARAAGSTPSDLTPCQDLVSWCHADRLPDVTLTGDETSGVLKSVDGFDLTGILSFDQALSRAGDQVDLPDATTVQVVLGSADADALHWVHGTNLYYAIDWGGVCIPPAGGSGMPLQETCAPKTSGVVLEARTGAFVVAGG
jgi:hypothetical protein